MHVAEMVRDLEEAASRLDLLVRYETGNFQGGGCVVAGEKFIILNKRHPVEIHFSILARTLRQISSIDDIFLRPAVRKAMDDVIATSQEEIETIHVE